MLLSHGFQTQPRITAGWNTVPPAEKSSLKTSFLAATREDAKGFPRIVLISASTGPHSGILSGPLWASASSFGDRLNIASQARGKELMVTLSSKISI